MLSALSPVLLQYLRFALQQRLCLVFEALTLCRLSVFSARPAQYLRLRCHNKWAVTMNFRVQRSCSPQWQRALQCFYGFFFSSNLIFSNSYSKVLPQNERTFLFSGFHCHHYKQSKSIPIYIPILCYKCDLDSVTLGFCYLFCLMNSPVRVLWRSVD